MSKIGHNGGPLSEGWIARHRSVRDHWLVGHGIHVKPADPDRKRCHTQGEAWEDLLMECRYADATVSNGGKKMDLRRGELIGAVSWLANRWNWTPKTVRRFLDQLENDGMIELKNPASEKGNQIGRQANVITVCNYEEYQSGIMQERQPKGQPEGDQRATRGRPEGNIYKDNKGTKEQEDSPLPPSGGERSASAAELFGEQPPAEPKAAAVKREVQEAFGVYNLAAKHFGFSECRTLTDARQKRLAKRLAEIGGVEGFKIALRSLARDEPFTRFLKGKAPARPGEPPFKLDIDRLLQTDGNLGDVLAKLADMAQQGVAQPAAEPWAGWDRSKWREQIAAHANGIWPRDKIGFWPGHPKCAAPPDLIAEMQRNGELGNYDSNGICKEKH